ncbi:MAG: hypothetical protein A2074_05395 [Candidatus Aquicultor primus]|uniref:Cytochrome C biogenesis protein transmembrane domain-containing protein n=1 Tax=Candidatus Aquicultor primus TaxID=1797195 RepID=A0A1F2UIH4_9ACTN|nr:MAG: hypothetical protein A2074_05395 [Candidatus Aquicultor primus]HCG98750.1 hypothetical protein [Actinomycetota bacterium]
MLDEIAQQFSLVLNDSLLLAFGLAFAGGLFTGFSPCVLPFFPAIIGYVAKNTEVSEAAVLVIVGLYFMQIIRLRLALPIKDHAG